MPKYLRVLAIVGGLTLIALLVAGVVAAVRITTAGRRVDVEIAAIKARGQPVAPEQIARPPVPDSQNAALVLRKVFARCPEKPTPAISAIGKPSPDLHALIPQAEQELKKHDGLLRLVETALRKPRCDFGVDWNQGFASEQPHYPRLRGLAHILAAMAIVDAGRGDPHRAARVIDDGLRLGELLKDEPVFVGQATRYDIMSTMTRALATVLSASTLDDADTTMLDTRLASIHPTQGWATAALGERAFGIGVFDELFGRRPSAVLAINPDIAKSIKRIRRDGDAGPRRFGSYAKLTWTMDELIFLERTRGLVRSVGRPYAEHMKACPPDYETFKWFALGTCILLPKWSTERPHTAEARIAAGRILLRLHSFRARHGRYPSRLSELGASDRWTTPVDPYSGRSLIYRRQGNGFILYSLGPDMKDNGGRRRTQAEHDTYDITWTAPY